MDIIGIMLSQMGVSKEELLEMAQGAATTVKQVDARLTRMENTLNHIARHLGVEPEAGEQGTIDHDSQT